ncbi:hypothetical protein BC829DRAFT_441655 [Chytridium lagenaria]|nr:hypothetical protein BC829DRAFT_441655 [Chytridium lagenaria]
MKKRQRPESLENADKDDSAKVLKTLEPIDNETKTQDDSMTDLVLSDVHITPDSTTPPTSTTLQTTTFTTKTQPPITITLSHHLATPIANVGYQVWPASFILANYLLAHPPTSTVLDIGTGVGFLPLLLTHLSVPTIFMTDLPHILPLSHLNTRHLPNIKPRVLDLTNPPPFLSSKPDTDNTQPLEYTWTNDDVTLFHETCNLIVAADIIYTPNVTFSLIKHLPSLLQTPTDTHTSTRVLLLALEKRVVFTMEDQEVTAPAWEYFLKTVGAFNVDREEDGWIVVVEMVDEEEFGSGFEVRGEGEMVLCRVFMERCGEVGEDNE